MSFDDDGFMSSAGARSVPFEQAGDTVTGLIISTPERRKQTEEDGSPKTFKDGTVREMFLVRIQTELRDPTDPTDDGVRTLYLKWKSHQAVVNAVRASGAPGLQIGGLLTLTLTGFGPKSSPKFNPPKLWSATYIPSAVTDSGFMGQTAVAAAAPATPPPPPPPAPVRSADQGEIMRRLQEQAAANAARLPQSSEPPF